MLPSPEDTWRFPRVQSKEAPGDWTAQETGAPTCCLTVDLNSVWRWHTGPVGKTNWWREETVTPLRRREGGREGGRDPLRLWKPEPVLRGDTQHAHRALAAGPLGKPQEGWQCPIGVCGEAGTCWACGFLDELAAGDKAPLFPASFAPCPPRVSRLLSNPALPGELSGHLAHLSPTYLSAFQN